jgi:hypothetical protein
MDNYELMKGNFYMDLMEYFEEHGKNNNYDWEGYLKNAKIWVTETSCNGDPDAKDGTDIPSEEMCMRITGQREETHG